MSHWFAARSSISLVVILIAAIAAACDGPTAPRLAPNTDLGLRVWATVSPTKLSIRDSVTPLRIRVYAQNTEDDTLRITSGGPPYVFTGDPTTSRGLEESFRIASDSSPLNGGPNTDYWGQPSAEFSLVP